MRREAQTFTAKHPFIMVKFNCDSSVIGHAPNSLAVILAPLLDSGIVTSNTGTITGPPSSAPEGIWAVGGDIELTCEHVRHCVKKGHSP